MKVLAANQTPRSPLTRSAQPSGRRTRRRVWMEAMTTTAARTATRVLTALGAATAAAALLLTCADGCSAATKTGQPSPNPDTAASVNPRTDTYAGTATDDARVVLYALGDVIRFGTCSGKNPLGLTKSWTAPLVALPGPLLDGNAECGRHVVVSNAQGTSFTATIVGKCGSCTGDDIALSPTLFRELAPITNWRGTINVTWTYAP